MVAPDNVYSYAMGQARHGREMTGMCNISGSKVLFLCSEAMREMARGQSKILNVGLGKSACRAGYEGQRHVSMPHNRRNIAISRRSARSKVRGHLFILPTADLGDGVQ